MIFQTQRPNTHSQFFIRKDEEMQEIKLWIGGKNPRVIYVAAAAGFLAALSIAIAGTIRHVMKSLARCLGDVSIVEPMSLTSQRPGRTDLICFYTA